jgi:hypothetical protein
MRKKKLEISAEEFAAWREDPVTQIIVKSLNDMAEQNKAGWLAASWDRGEADQSMLTELKTRADAYRSLAELSYEDLI